MHERGGLQRVPWLLATHVAAGDTPELGIDERYQPRLGVLISVSSTE